MHGRNMQSSRYTDVNVEIFFPKMFYALWIDGYMGSLLHLRLDYLKPLVDYKNLYMHLFVSLYQRSIPFLYVTIIISIVFSNHVPGAYWEKH
jgi:hypothetical protein